MHNFSSVSCYRENREFPFTESEYLGLLNGRKYVLPDVILDWGFYDEMKLIFGRLQIKKRFGNDVRNGDLVLEDKSEVSWPLKEKLLTVGWT